MLHDEAFKRMFETQSRPLPMEVADIRKEIAEIQAWLQRYGQLDWRDKQVHQCRLGNLTRRLKPFEEKEEKLRQERIACEEAARRKEQEETRRQVVARELEDKRRAEAQAALEAEKLRRDAEAKLEREIKFKFIVWRLQTTWRHEDQGRVYRENPPTPELNSDQRRMWDKWEGLFRFEDEAERARQQGIAWIKQIARSKIEDEERCRRQEEERKARRQKEYEAMSKTMEAWLEWHVGNGPHPVDVTNYADLVASIAVMEDWLDEFESFEWAEALEVQRDIRNEIERGKLRINLIEAEHLRKTAISGWERNKAAADLAKYGGEWEAMKAREEGELRRGKNTDR
jgi:hypothetical protein